jgi:hypothetical protein
MYLIRRRGLTLKPEEEGESGAQRLERKGDE